MTTRDFEFDWAWLVVIQLVILPQQAIRVTHFHRVITATREATLESLFWRRRTARKALVFHQQSLSVSVRRVSNLFAKLTSFTLEVIDGPDWNWIACDEKAELI